MRLLHLALAFALVTVTLGPGSACAADDFFVFKASLSLPVTMFVPRPAAATDLIVTKKLANNDLINLALGRALGSKVDGKTEILAFAAAFQAPSNSPLAKLIVFDPSQNGLAQIKATVAQLTSLDFGSAYLTAGSQRGGVGTMTIQPTVLGDPAANALLGGTLSGGGEGSGPHNGVAPPSVSVKGILSGRLRFRFTTGGVLQTFDGFVTMSKGKVSGKLLGTFTQ